MGTFSEIAREHAVEAISKKLIVRYRAATDPAEKEGEQEREHKRFYYEEHSCPTNWLNPVMVYDDGDLDPHGLLRFVATRDEATFPKDELRGPNDRDRAIVEFIEASATTRP